MNKHSIIKFICENNGAELPLIEQKFNITYRQAKAIVDGLVEKNILRYESGFRYVLVGRTTERQKSDGGDATNTTDLDRLRFRALKLCIEKNSASVFALQEALSIGYVKACGLIDWMEENGYISKFADGQPRKVLITLEQFKRYYGISSERDGEFDVRTKIIGVGGVGCALIKELIKNAAQGAEYFVSDTKEDVLRLSGCENKIQISPAQKQSEIRMRAVYEERLKNTDLLITVSGFGGYAGSTYTPIIAEIAKNLGITVISIACFLFESEFGARAARSEKCLEKLRSLSTAVLVFPKKRDVPVADAMPEMNREISEIINSIVTPIYKNRILNISFGDIKTLLKGGGIAYCGTAVSDSGKDAVEEALKHLSGAGVVKFNRCLVDVTGGPNLQLDEIMSVGEAISGAVDKQAYIALTAGMDESLGDRIRVTVLGLTAE